MANPAIAGEVSETIMAKGRLTVRSLTKNYGSTPALSDVSLDVEPGEFFTLLGPSGSGKTTTMMAIAGFVGCDSGAIYLDGRRLDAIPAESRDLGVVFQNYALFPHMTVAQNLAFPLEVRRMDREMIASRLRASLEMVDLIGQENRYPSQLSGGQQQRVAVARALIFQPAVLLMDEPLGALDKNMRARLQLELRNLQKRLGITTVYVTHDQEEAFTMSDRIAVMANGRVQQVGTPADLYENPASRFVADFVGDNNFLDGVVVSHDGRISVVQLSGIGTVSCRRSAAPVGGCVTLALRPEHLSIGDTAPGWNRVSGTVQDRVYTGSSTKYWIDAAEGYRFLFRVANTAHAPRYAIGDQMTLSFRPHDAIPFGSEDGPTGSGG
jgi:putative spermidine/putrescine transport system ATP-binding protein